MKKLSQLLDYQLFLLAQPPLYDPLLGVFQFGRKLGGNGVAYQIPPPENCLAERDLALQSGDVAALVSMRYELNSCGYQGCYTVNSEYVRRILIFRQPLRICKYFFDIQTQRGGCIIAMSPNIFETKSVFTTAPLAYVIVLSVIINVAISFTEEAIVK